MSSRQKIFAIVVLTSINLVNYLDRYILSALLPFIKQELHWSDAQLGLLGTAFTFSYSFSAPFLGFLGDRISRKWLASMSVFAWSVATGLTGKAQNYAQILGIRAAVGIGEAGYGPVAPTIINDLYSHDVRSRMLSIYYIGTPLGSALGIIFGGYFAHRFGWRAAFLFAAIPGLLLAVLALFLPEPKRNEANGKNPGLLQTLKHLLQTPSYIYNLLGTTAMTFATGGLAYWFPTFLFRMRGWRLLQATQFFGATSVVAGIAGTIFGGFIADMWQVKNKKAYFYVSAIGLLCAVPFTILSITIHNKFYVPQFVFLTVFFLFFNISPLNAAILSVVPTHMRATAMALNILVIHLLGDAVSTVTIGKVSDATGSLATGMMIGPFAILLGGIILLLGANSLERDQMKV